MSVYRSNYMTPPLDSPFVKPLSLVPDAEDLALHEALCAPAMVTRRLRELVPLLDVTGCVVEEIGPARTVLSLPLLDSAMNQNGTHQASVFYLVADYTLGVAMCGVLPGVYVTGVHDRCHQLPVQYWLKRGTVTHLAPGTGTLRAEAAISPEAALNLRRQLVERGRGELTDTVRIYQDDHLVAEAQHTMGLYADVPRSPGTRANVFQVQNLKTSALMIAGLRDDPLSQTVAGDQGRAIARRMSLATPQLPSLVKARTLHIEALMRSSDVTFPQVLVLGVGLDPKPVTLARDGQRWFGVDLRDMLREREERFRPAGTDRLRLIAGDLRLDKWDGDLLAAGFDPLVPTLIIVEGVSMYLPAAELTNLLQKLRTLNQSPGTRVWLDHVTDELFALDSIEVKSFLAAMTRLGEPFVLGFGDVSALMRTAATWHTESSQSAGQVLGLSDPVYREYRFSVLSPVSS